MFSKDICVRPRSAIIMFRFQFLPVQMHSMRAFLVDTYSAHSSLWELSKKKNAGEVEYFSRLHPTWGLRRNTKPQRTSWILVEKKQFNLKIVTGDKTIDCTHRTCATNVFSWCSSSQQTVFFRFCFIFAIFSIFYGAQFEFEL